MQHNLTVAHALYNCKSRIPAVWASLGIQSYQYTDILGHLTVDMTTCW